MPEKDNLKAYQDKSNTSHEHLEFVPAGLYISFETRQIAAIPDDLVPFSYCGLGCIKVCIISLILKEKL